MKALDRAMIWVENNTNQFVVIACGIVWSLVIYTAYLALKDFK